METRPDERRNLQIGKGSGLGLAQVYGFAKQSGGGVTIETTLGEGTIVRVYLPRAAGRLLPAAPDAAAASPEAPAHHRTILLVDDDRAVRDVTSALLVELGYGVVAAGSGEEALALLRRDEPVDLLMVDYAMPGMNGAEVARAAAELRPGLPTLFITGYADLKALREIGEDRVVRKPFQDDELPRRLAEAFRQGPSNIVRLRRI
ncbi:response regulator [Ancylobacter lacus]|uniref:response regulator n=1 Tax=Ancylobacter lacus TaxID=2579970 RepID=UPI001BCC6B60|nr:response regulator [Ancylobacter lacus]MBS7539511.1 response regulator [Ancylobacter lacus]